MGPWAIDIWKPPELRIRPPSQECSERSHWHIQQAGVVLVTCTKYWGLDIVFSLWIGEKYYGLEETSYGLCTPWIHQVSNYHKTLTNTRFASRFCNGKLINMPKYAVSANVEEQTILLVKSNLSKQYAIRCNSQWIGLRENLQETMVFTIKYGGFL